jgi:6-phosphogluconolactonase
MDVEILVADDAAAAASLAAKLLVDAVARGRSIALAGGSTPRRAYELAAAAYPDWSGTELWYGDDRCVPADDERSNQLLVRESLLDHLVVQPRAVHGIQTELGPEAAAAAYDRELRGTTLGLAFLGLGSDGHTASLFPGAASLVEGERLAVAAEAGLAPFVPRVTLTIPALAAAEHVVFLVVGADKAGPARRAFAEPPSIETPASLVRSSRGTTSVILDADAASQLSSA